VFKNDTKLIRSSPELFLTLYSKYSCNRISLFRNLKISPQNIIKSDISISNISSQFSSSSDIKSTETTKSDLIQRILHSFKPILNYESLSDNTTNTSLSSIDKTIISCQSKNLLNKIFIHFKDKNELGRKPQIDDLLEEIEYTKKCSCHRIEIIFNNYILNQQLSYKQKQSILRVILRRQQIFDRYFS